jgi:hypothetical protein
MCSFMVLVLMAVYYGSVKAKRPERDGSRPRAGQLAAVFTLQIKDDKFKLLFRGLW